MADELKKLLEKQKIKRDNTEIRTTFKPKSLPRQNSLLGNLGYDGYRDQGSISAPEEKSLREKALNLLDKIDRKDDNIVAGLVTQPIKSGLRLLRPDKYFDNVRTESDILPAIGSLVLDATAVAPSIRPVGRSVGKAVNEITDTAMAAKDALTPYANKGIKAFKATGDLPITLRTKNALNASTLGKQFPGDVTSNAYFDISPEEVAAKLKITRDNAPAGAVLGDTNMSINSTPVYWNEVARIKDKALQAVRTGENAYMNTAGFKGKRVKNAIPKEFIKDYDNLYEEFDKQQLMMKKDLDAGIIDSRTYNSHINQKNPNVKVLRDLTSNVNAQPVIKQFLENYKPTLDNPIKAVNAKTGLNFPLAKIQPKDIQFVDGELTNVYNVASYDMPEMLTINNPLARFKRIGQNLKKEIPALKAMNSTMRSSELNAQSKARLQDMKEWYERSSNAFDQPAFNRGAAQYLELNGLENTPLNKYLSKNRQGLQSQKLDDLYAMGETNLASDFDIDHDFEEIYMGPPRQTAQPAPSLSRSTPVVSPISFDRFMHINSNLRPSTPEEFTRLR